MIAAEVSAWRGLNPHSGSVEDICKTSSLKHTLEVLHRALYTEVNFTEQWHTDSFNTYVLSLKIQQSVLLTS